MNLRIYILLFIVLSGCVTAKTQPPPPSGLPSPYSTGYYRIGWIQNDSGAISANRQPDFTPRFPGTEVFYVNPGVDTSKWLWTGQGWVKELKSRAGDVIGALG